MHIAGDATSYFAWKRMVETVKVILIHCPMIVQIQILCCREDALLVGYKLLNTEISFNFQHLSLM